MFTYLSIYLSVSLNGQVINSQEKAENAGIKRNASYNLEEIKVRWKKSALENCQGAPCSAITAPGAVTSIVATPTGPTSASVSFVPPINDGGSPITGYTETATPTSTGVAPAKRKSSGIITVTGNSSPISVSGLTLGVNYFFSVVAMNAVGGSSVTITITTVTPCTLNTATPQQTTPIYLNTVIEEPITISTTGRATGIGAASGLPEGVDASWSANVITISGTPTELGTFEYTIPLTGGCGSVNATGTITVIPFICGTSTISDYDGNVYNTVSIGQQCWTKQNLKVTKYNDGSNIPEIPGNGTWNNTIVTGARTVHGDLPSNLSTYGFLYNWYAATDEKKICPTGWHVPTLDELQNMISFIGIEEAGKKLKKMMTYG